MAYHRDLRACVVLLAVSALCCGCGRSTHPDNTAQIRLWREQGRLAAGPWTEQFRNGGYSGTVDKLWVRREARSGWLALVDVEYAASSSLGRKAETDPGVARRTPAPSDLLTEASRARIPDGCFVIRKSDWGLTLTTATGEQHFAASHLRSLGDGHTLVFGASRGEHHLWENSEAAVLDSTGARVASWTIPPGAFGRIDFLGTLLLSVHRKDGATTLTVLDPRRLTPLADGAPLAIIIDDSFAATRTFTHLIVRDPTAATPAAKQIFTPDGPLELPLDYDRLHPYRLDGTRIVATGGSDALWQVDAWLVERDGAIVAVLDRNGAILASGITSAEPVSVSGFVHAVGSPGTVPGFAIRDAQGQWQVVWLDGIEPSPVMAQRDWCLSSAAHQRGKLNVQRINEHNNRVMAEIAYREAGRREAERLKTLAEAKSREYGEILTAFEGLVAEKRLAEALDRVERIDRRAMHQAHPGRWERACVTATRLALKQDSVATWLRMRAVIGSIPMLPDSEPARTLAELDHKIYWQTAARQTLADPAKQAGGAPSSYVRELPGDAMRAMEANLRRELQSAGATYYAR